MSELNGMENVFSLRSTSANCNTPRQAGAAPSSAVFIAPTHTFFVFAHGLFPKFQRGGPPYFTGEPVLQSYELTRN